jgi:hypothetical protein
MGTGIPLNRGLGIRSRGFFCCAELLKVLGILQREICKGTPGQVD